MMLGELKSRFQVHFLSERQGCFSDNNLNGVYVKTKFYSFKFMYLTLHYLQCNKIKILDLWPVLFIYAQIC